MSDRTMLTRGQTLTDDGAGQWVVLEVVAKLGATALVKLRPASAPEPPAAGLDDAPTRPLRRSAGGG